MARAQYVSPRLSSTLLPFRDQRVECARFRLHLNLARLTLFQQRKMERSGVHRMHPTHNIHNGMPYVTRIIACTIVTRLQMVY